MNAVEIEEDVSTLAAVPFDADAFAWRFQAASGNEETTIERLGLGPVECLRRTRRTELTILAI